MGKPLLRSPPLPPLRPQRPLGATLVQLPRRPPGSGPCGAKFSPGAAARCRCGAAPEPPGGSGGGWGGAARALGKARGYVRQPRGWGAGGITRSGGDGVSPVRGLREASGSPCSPPPLWGRALLMPTNAAMLPLPLFLLILYAKYFHAERRFHEARVAPRERLVVSTKRSLNSSSLAHLLLFHKTTALHRRRESPGTWPQRRRYGWVRSVPLAPPRARPSC